MTHFEELKKVLEEIDDREGWFNYSENNWEKFLIIKFNNKVFKNNISTLFLLQKNQNFFFLIF